MKKSDLIEKIAVGADISKAAAGRVVDEFTGAITEELKNGGEVQLVKFATFKVSERAERNGRNPQTGESIKIPAAKVPQAKMSKTLLS